MIEDILVKEGPNLINYVLSFIGYLMPIPLAMLALYLWNHYKKESGVVGIKWTLFEIQVPRDIAKTPAAMELFFANTFAPKLWFSLELVSIDGRVRFFIRTPSSIKDLVETQIYAQYPQAKVIETEDYVFNIPEYSKDGDWYMWGCEFAKKKDDFLPIKTYRGFGDEMKAGVDEEYKVDPITPVIEFLGSLARGQQMWVQILTRQNVKKYYSEAKKKKVDFNDAAQEFLLKILKPYTKTQKTEGATDIDIRTPKNVEPTVKAINDQLGQIHFDCGIRVVTLSDKKIVSEDLFNNLRRSSRLIFRQYSLAYSNEFNRVNSTEFDSAWSDPMGISVIKTKKRMLNFYRNRMFFHPSLLFDINYPKWLAPLFPSGKPNIFVLSSEELATIFHFPGMVSETPSFKRVETKIAKPPSNLPV